MAEEVFLLEFQPPVFEFQFSFLLFQMGYLVSEMNKSDMNPHGDEQEEKKSHEEGCQDEDP
jgi:hypothetical protein